MTVRRPLVVINGEISELPDGDSLPIGISPSQADIQIFQKLRNITETLEWVKPDGASMVFIEAIGAGGDGGDGAADSGIDDGGGGGGSGERVIFMIQASWLPATLNVEFNSASYVSVKNPDGALSYVSANYGEDGGNGNGTDGGAGGAGGALSTRSMLSWLGTYQGQAGQTGGAGASVLSNAPDLQQTQVLGAGSGGGSGGPSSPGLSGNIKIGSTVLVAGVGAEVEGNDSVSIKGFRTGGAGGGGGDAENLTGQGGNGGSALYPGCGGGGGGASLDTLPPGQGGSGGMAQVTIISF